MAIKETVLGRMDLARWSWGRSVAPGRAIAALLPPGVRTHLGPMLLFASMATAVMGPVLLAPRTRAIGHPDNDVWNHVWGFHFVADRLLGFHLPTRTDAIGWPPGGSIWFIDTHAAVITLPVQLLFGPVAAYNAAAWFAFFVAGASAYALAWVVTRSRPAATFAGVAFMSSPYLLGQAYNGITETLSVGWVALAVLALRHVVHKPGAFQGALAGAATGIAVLSSTYHGLIVAVAAAGLAAREGWRIARALLRWGPPGAGALRDWFYAAAGFAVAMALVAGPTLVLFGRTLSAPDAIIRRDPGFVFWTLVLHNIVDAAALVRPGSAPSPDLKETYGESLLIVGYLGHAVLWPALASLLTGYHRVVRPWLALACVYVLIALGPFLYLDGDYVAAADGWLPLPYLPFGVWIPPFKMLSHTYRFIVGAQLALAVLAAFCVRAACERWSWAPRAVVLLALARVGEATLATPVPFPLPATQIAVPAAYRWVGEGVVLDLPASLPVLVRARYFGYQLYHRQPVPFTLNEPTPPYLEANHYTAFVLALERSLVDQVPGDVPWLDVVAGRQQALADGLRWLVVHEDQYAPATLAKVRWFLDLTATPVGRTGVVSVYRLDPLAGE